jgi:hypothetical protein
MSVAFTCVITLEWKCVGCLHFNNKHVFVMIANMASIRGDFLVFRLDCVIAESPYYLCYVHPSVLLSARTYSTIAEANGRIFVKFHFEDLWKFVEKFQIWLILDKNLRHST